MEVEIEYDYVQKTLMGNSYTIELKEGTTLGTLFDILDKKIVVAASEQGIEPDGITFLKNDGTCACMLQVNGNNAAGLLDYVLQDGDRVEVVFGFCGG
ncbi:MAG: MoaD/ThiS family protein [Methanosarcinaceae archaeon]|nr:MoaD/ThiS family protein [Methanosarcinaceae archaeon]